MSDEVTLEGARILIVEDEADVVETLKELLDMCAVDTAADFETGKALLDANGYDIAIFDIMGVRGYDLLAIAREKNLPAMMLTAHALTAEDFSRSITGGAVAYIPKEKMGEIGVYLTDLESSCRCFQQYGKNKRQFMRRAVELRERDGSAAAGDKAACGHASVSSFPKGPVFSLYL